MSQFTQPPQPQQPYAPGMPPGSHPMRNGLGTAALVLGIIGSVSGLIPFLFWLAGILGLIALILGMSGRGRSKRGEASNKGVATFGAVLGLVSLILSVVGAVITFKAVDDAVNDINAAVAESSASAKPGTADDGAKDDAAKSEEKPSDGTLKENDAAVYDDGLEVTVSAAATYSPDEFAVGHTKGNHAYKVSIVIENKTKKKFDATLVTVEARAGEDGVNAEEIFDDTVGEGFDGTVLPGKKATVQLAFDAPKDAKNLTVEVSPDVDRDASQWDLKL
jgi:Telomeric repeat-binding factor 2.